MPLIYTFAHHLATTEIILITIKLKVIISLSVHLKFSICIDEGPIWNGQIHPCILIYLVYSYFRLISNKHENGSFEILRKASCAFFLHNTLVSNHVNSDHVPTKHQYLLSRFLGVTILQLFIIYSIYDYLICWRCHSNGVNTRSCLPNISDRKKTNLILKK
jgi:hypothetical protein